MSQESKTPFYISQLNKDKDKDKDKEQPKRDQQPPKGKKGGGAGNGEKRVKSGDRGKLSNGEKHVKSAAGGKQGNGGKHVKPAAGSKAGHSGNQIKSAHSGKPDSFRSGNKVGKQDKKGSPSSSIGKGSPASSRVSAEEVRVGDRIVVTIKRIGINGEGVGYYKRKAVFIDGALPDEVVKARITRVEPGYLNAETVELEKRSPERREPTCPVYSECGGCQLQHMSYSAQMKAKEEIVRESFRRYANIEQLPMRPILGMDEPRGYRNKAQLQVGREGKELVTGLYAAGSHRLIDISGCEVQHPVVNEVIEGVKRILAELDIPIYNERTREGAVRTIVARVSQTTGKVQLTFITAVDRLPDSRRLVQRVRETLPMVITIAQNVNKGKTSLIFGDRTIVLWGSEQLEETLGDVRFALSPRAFFQLNPEQTVKLYGSVQEAAALSGEELVVDAYCGTGTIGLWLAPYAKEVRGIEVIAEAVQDARDNARASGIDNARFFEGRAERLLPEWVAQGVRPDVVVVDPPRTGCERSLLDAVAFAKPKRLVYVSCNPATLAKDCQVLLASGYKLEWVQPVDMFPMTSHVEAVCSLIYKGF